MVGSGSIFLEISLPNAQTWFYFSALLAIALFLKFSRLLSVRNLDVVTLFLPVPGFLLLVESKLLAENQLLAESKDAVRWGYLWLIVASGYLFLRCLADLALVRRPALTPNLTLGGLIWLMGALFVSLAAVAARQPHEPSEKQGLSQTPIDDVRLFSATLSGQDPDDPYVRVWVERGLTLACHFAIMLGLVLIGWRHFEDVQAGAAAAAFYLLLPYTFLLVPGTGPGIGRWDHAWPMALMVWAVLAYRRAGTAGALLGLAAGSVIFPALTFPIWLGFYRGRGACRFALAFVLTAGLCLAAISGWFWLNGEQPNSLRPWQLATWLPWGQLPSDVPSFWQAWDIHWAYRLPVFIVYVAFLLPTLFWPAPKNLAHVLALSAATFIGVQFWYADQGGVYVLWYLPFLLLLVFRPNLSTYQPPIPPETRLARWSKALARLVLRRFRAPVPTVSVR